MRGAVSSWAGQAGTVEQILRTMHGWRGLLHHTGWRLAHLSTGTHAQTAGPITDPGRSPIPFSQPAPRSQSLAMTSAKKTIYFTGKGPEEWVCFPPEGG